MLGGYANSGYESKLHSVPFGPQIFPSEKLLITAKRYKKKKSFKENKKF